MTDVQNIKYLYETIRLTKTLKFTMQTKKMFKNVNKSVIDYQNSELLLLNQHDWLVSMTLYINHWFLEKSDGS